MIHRRTLLIHADSQGASTHIITGITRPARRRAIITTVTSMHEGPSSTTTSTPTMTPWTSSREKHEKFATAMRVRPQNKD